MGAKTEYNQNLTPEEAFQVTLLLTAEIAKNVLIDRNKDALGLVAKQRRKLLSKLNGVIEEINQTYKGTVPDNFVTRSEIFHKTIEAAMNTLLKSYKT